MGEAKEHSAANVTVSMKAILGQQAIKVHKVKYDDTFQ